MNPSVEEPPAKKSLGQHWLNDQASLQAMLQAADVGPNDTVLEIGPGPGALTKLLVGAAKQVTAVEYDQALAKALPQKVPASNLTVVNQDILQFDFGKLPPNYKVVANIPYYLTSNLIRVLCEASNPFRSAALLVQKEVAERVCAEPGSMSLLSVSAQMYCEASLGRIVPAKLFTPPPKVDSQVLILEYRQQPLFADLQKEQFFRVVKAGFSQRRKTLLNSLSAGLQLSKTVVQASLEACSIPTTARAQTLDLRQWHKLQKALSKYAP